jgi:hypothetical protein
MVEYLLILKIKGDMMRFVGTAPTGTAGPRQLPRHKLGIMPDGRCAHPLQHGPPPAAWRSKPLHHGCTAPTPCSMGVGTAPTGTAGPHPPVGECGEVGEVPPDAVPPDEVGAAPWKVVRSRSWCGSHAIDLA